MIAQPRPPIGSKLQALVCVTTPTFFSSPYFFSKSDHFFQVQHFWFWYNIKKQVTQPLSIINVAPHSSRCNIGATLFFEAKSMFFPYYYYKCCTKYKYKYVRAQAHTCTRARISCTRAHTCTHIFIFPGGTTFCP